MPYVKRNVTKYKKRVKRAARPAARANKSTTRRVYPVKRTYRKRYTNRAAMMSNPQSRPNTLINTDITRQTGATNGALLVFATDYVFDQVDHQSIQATLHSEVALDAAFRKGYQLLGASTDHELTNQTEAPLRYRAYKCITRSNMNRSAFSSYVNGMNNNGNSGLAITALAATPYMSPDFVQYHYIASCQKGTIQPGKSRMFKLKAGPRVVKNSEQNDVIVLKGTAVYLFFIEGVVGLDATLLTPTTSIPDVFIKSQQRLSFRELPDNVTNITLNNDATRGTNIVRFVQPNTGVVDTSGVQKA